MSNSALAKRFSQSEESNCDLYPGLSYKGVVKKVLPDKKCVFLSLHNKDIFVSLFEFTKKGLEPKEGESVIFALSAHQRGWRGSSLKKIDGQKTHESYLTVQQPGVVKWYNEKKGYGFVSIANGMTAFVHWRTCKQSNVAASELVKKPRVEVVVVPGCEPGDLKVSHIEIV